MSMEESATERACAFSSVAIAGIGLIGASIAGAIKQSYPGIRIMGIDVHEPTLAAAVEKGWVDQAVQPDDPAFEAFIREECELVIIATPVAFVDDYFEKLGKWDYRGVVTDTISTKSHILEAGARLLAYPDSFIPGHPMAGSEKNGIEGARPDLFSGINWILCPNEETVPEQFQALHEFIRGLGARIISIKREDHDSWVAIVSHVPHMVAASLMNLANRHSDESRALMRLAAGGFKDSTRIAAGSPKLWSGIAFDNVTALSAGLREMQDIIGEFVEALEGDNRLDFSALLQSAADARRALPVAWLPETEKLLEVRIPMTDRMGVVAEVTTVASSVGCNIQSIEIDHTSESSAVLSLVLTDEGDIGQLMGKLIMAGFSASFSPLAPREHVHVD